MSCSNLPPLLPGSLLLVLGIVQAVFLRDGSRTRGPGQEGEMFQKVLGEEQVESRPEYLSTGTGNCVVSVRVVVWIT